MTATLISAAFAGLLFAGILFCMRMGWYIGRRRLKSCGGEEAGGLGVIDGAVFGLLGLLIAFTFTGAATRFEARRALVTNQLNAVGTAWLRLDLLPEPEKTTVRENFRKYIDTQIELLGSVRSTLAGLESSAVQAGLHRLSEDQQAVWDALIVAVEKESRLPLAQTVLPAMNEVFDLTTVRLMASLQHPPLAVYILLAVLVLASALLAGFGMAKSAEQSLLHLIVFAVIISASVYLILDIEYPRLGLITIDSMDQSMIDLRKGMD